MYEEILPKEELTRLKRSFALFDVDGDGTISTKVIYPATQFDGCSQKTIYHGIDTDKKYLVIFDS